MNTIYLKCFNKKITELIELVFDSSHLLYCLLILKEIRLSRHSLLSQIQV